MTRGIRPRQRRVGGFTLVELLIVIAIIGVLAGMLVPALMSAVRHARTLACQSNLKQIATAVLEYTTDHKGRIPPTEVQETGLHWCNILAQRGLSAQNTAGLADDVRSSQGSVFLCPSSTDLRVEYPVSFEGEEAPDAPEVQGWYRVGNDTIQTDCSYFWNGFVGGNEDLRQRYPSLKASYSNPDPDGTTYFHNISEIPQTSAMVMVADGVFHTGHWYPEYIAARHPGTFDDRRLTNVAFYDGHVESLDRYAPKSNGKPDWSQEVPAEHAGESPSQDNWDAWAWKPIIPRDHLEGGPPYFKLPQR